MKKSSLNNKVIIVTGVAGFIGANLTLKLLKTFSDVTVIGIDNCNDYYDVSLKEYRLRLIERCDKNRKNIWKFIKGDIANQKFIFDVFNKYKPSIVVNLAAQAGVRYSIINPDSYINSNLIGFYNILEACRNSYENNCKGVEHLVYASSSSVYGGSTNVPFKEIDFVDNPVSLYAATKKSNELLAYSYSKLYEIPCTGLRFFTVYGPAGRPDMAYFSFTQKLIKDEKIAVFNYGNCKRDFTYIDDIVEGIIRVMQGAPEKTVDLGKSIIPPYAIYNIGKSSPENLLDFIEILACELIRTGVLKSSFDIASHMELVAMQPGDVPVTYADTSKLEHDFGFKPSTNLQVGLKYFSEWFKDYYKI